MCKMSTSFTVSQIPWPIRVRFYTCKSSSQLKKKHTKDEQNRKEPNGKSNRFWTNYNGINMKVAISRRVCLAVLLFWFMNIHCTMYIHCGRYNWLLLLLFRCRCCCCCLCFGQFAFCFALSVCANRCCGLCFRFFSLLLFSIVNMSLCTMEEKKW